MFIDLCLGGRSLPGEFVIVNVFVIEAQGKGRKGTAERRAGWWHKFTHSSLLVLASCLRNNIA